VLEDRRVLSVTITEHRGTLFINGDANANVIQITDNGTNTVGNITVTADGGAAQTSTTAIKRIVFFTGQGNDQVTYNLTGDVAAGTYRGIGGLLGTGDDTFTANLNGHAINGGVAIGVDGGSGADTLTVNAAGVNVGAKANLAIGLLGGKDSDNVNVTYDGMVNGRLLLGVLGGDLFGFGFGRRNTNTAGDTIAANVNVAAGSTGSFRAGVAGSAGNDKLTFNVTGDTSTLKAFKAILFTGRGTDTTTTSNVTVKTGGFFDGPPEIDI